MTYSLETLAKLALGLALCWAGKHVYALFHPDERLEHELTDVDNPAFAASLGSYYAAILVALGGPLTAGRGLPPGRQLASAAGWGLASILLLNLASLAKRRLVLRRLSLSAEIGRRNLAAGLVSGGSHLANGLLVYGALNGDRSLLEGAALWLYGQVWLSLAALALPYFLRCQLPREIARGNRAVGWAAAGALVAAGNLMRLALTGELGGDWSAGWEASLVSVTAYCAVGLAALLLLSELVDRVLLPGATLRRELVGQKEPNAGVGFLLAALWVGCSFLAGWAL